MHNYGINFYSFVFIKIYYKYVIQWTHEFIDNYKLIPG